MVEIAEIDGEESLRTWLEETGQSREACIWLAHRAAMRVLPVCWGWAVSSEAARNRDLTASLVLRPCLITWILDASLSSDVRVPAVIAAAAASAASIEAAVSALKVAEDAYDIADASYSFATDGYSADAYAGAAASAHAAGYASYTVHEGANATAAAGVYAAAAAAAKAGVPAANDIWRGLRQDCAFLLNISGSLVARWSPLWPDGPRDADFWPELREQLRAADDDWSFWITWYDHALTGTETRHDLLKRIALSDLPADGTARAPEDYDAFWQGTDAEVNARINAIWAEWQTANATARNEEAEPDAVPSSTTQFLRPLKLSLSQARDILESDHPLLRDRCQKVVAEVDEALSYHNVRIPNDPDELAAHNQVTQSLQFAKALATSVHDALPADFSDRPVSEEDVSRFRAALADMHDKLVAAASYIDRTDHTPTYGGLLKLGCATALGGLVAIALGITVAGAIPAIYGLLYGKEAVKSIAGLLPQGASG